VSRYQFAHYYDGSMKTRISITLSASLLAEVDRRADKSGSRSAFVEGVLLPYLRANSRRASQARDLELLDAASERLNKEALDVLKYQA
jgi:metal-responsive CopG/Arc/MetJ family transcriptional regulator